MKKRYLIVVLTLLCGLNLRAQSEKLTELQTSIQMFTVDSLYYSTLKDLISFVESKDTSYYHRAKLSHAQLNRETNFLAQAGKPDETWSRLYAVNLGVAQAEVGIVKIYYFDDPQFFKQVSSDKDTSKFFVPLFVQPPKAKGTKAGTALFDMVRCSGDPEYYHKSLVEKMDKAQTLLRYSMGILEKYLKEEGK